MMNSISHMENRFVALPDAFQSQSSLKEMNAPLVKNCKNCVLAMAANKKKNNENNN